MMMRRFGVAWQKNRDSGNSNMIVVLVCYFHYFHFFNYIRHSHSLFSSFLFSSIPFPLLYSLSFSLSDFQSFFLYLFFFLIPGPI